ncbi:hypothetical protein [Apilactobacillus xinyiensis]|uniref:hypothetical protein n=1 Tax=Apilactobacillus xinyiensis TaxID=2841032 RepID=UPI00200F4F5F|nr:hypothetical protein [Apilactobacillus xinyiensis]MCL0330380.1 hypothetical protein [Apilactobacillus xinyiensis]
MNSLNVLGIFLLLVGFLFLIGLSFRLIFNSDNVFHPLRKFIYYFGSLILGIIIVYIVSINSIKINETKVINTSLSNPKAVTMNLHANSDVKYFYDKKLINLNFENGVPSFHIKAKASTTIKITTIQQYRNEFFVYTFDKTKLIINYSNK